MANSTAAKSKHKKPTQPSKPNVTRISEGQTPAKPKPKNTKTTSTKDK
jgi:hypothetical protein